VDNPWNKCNQKPYLLPRFNHQTSTEGPSSHLIIIILLSDWPVACFHYHIPCFPWLDSARHCPVERHWASWGQRCAWPTSLTYQRLSDGKRHCLLKSKSETARTCDSSQFWTTLTCNINHVVITITEHQFITFVLYLVDQWSTSTMLWLRLLNINLLRLYCTTLINGHQPYHVDSRWTRVERLMHSPATKGDVFAPQLRHQSIQYASLQFDTNTFSSVQNPSRLHYGANKWIQDWNREVFYTGLLWSTEKSWLTFSSPWVLNIEQIVIRYLLWKLSHLLRWSKPW